ncbi:MAG TPA: heavy metal-associated domain-containing protein [Flavobacterium sp.]|jgi:copper chaperone CopZ
MKAAKIVIALVLFVFAPATAQSGKTVRTILIQTKIACDHCKVCETCGGLLERTLIKEKGIQMITLDQDAMTIKVIYNSRKTSPELIKEAISKLGYDADDVKAQPDAVARLDGCCRP